MREYHVKHLEVHRTTPIGDLYDILFDLADAFSFNRHSHRDELPPILQEEENELRERLKPYFLKKRHTYNWHGWRDADLHIFVYRCCAETKEILKRYCPDFFFQLQQLTAWNERVPCPEFEDPCFYKNGSIVLGTVSHERMCTAYPPLTEEPRIAEIGAWFDGITYTIYTLPE